MTFFKFEQNDIIDTIIRTYPSSVVELCGDQLTGSVTLEKEFLNSAIENRLHQGYSQKKSGQQDLTGPFTASVEFKTATYKATGINTLTVNQNLFHCIKNCLYPYYKIFDNDYSPQYAGSDVTTFRVISIPEIYYDGEVLSGSFTASAKNSAGVRMYLYDNGRGGIYSGSLTGTLVGNIFYQEGMVVLTKTDLNNFGADSPDNDKWKVNFKGVHKIPCKIFKCKAPAGQLNASTNSTFIQSPTTGDYKGQKQIVSSDGSVYITTIGLFDHEFQLVGLVKLGQPIKKKTTENLLFRIRQDW